MPDLNRESLEIWNSLKPMVDEEIKSQIRGAVQRRKAKVTTAPSLATNTIGVTEPFGSEIFVPFATNLISATVGDVVWVEFMYGATNAFVSMFASADEKDWDVAGDLTVHGVLDVTPRRCEATLSSQGWYRAMKYSAASADNANGGRSFVVDLTITRSYSNTNNEIHRISLVADYYNVAFVDEMSKSNAVAIDKVRYMWNGANAYIDIHYNVSVSNDCCVNLDVKTDQNLQAKFASVQGFSAVADSPAGETVLTEYTFAANTISPFIRQIRYSGTTDANGNLEIPLTVANYASKHYVLQYASTYATALTIAGNLLYVKCFKYNGTAQANANVTVYLLEN